MSALTRSAASSFSLVSSPKIFVFTGPAEGNVSLIVSAWNRIAASANTVEYTPQAPSQGSVRSSYLKPSTSKPLTKVSAHSLRLSMSDSTMSHISLARELRSLSSNTSAKFSSNSPPIAPSASGISVISILPSSSVTLSGFTISISSSPSPTSSSTPFGAEYSPFSIAISKIHFLCV